MMGLVRRLGISLFALFAPANAYADPPAPPGWTSAASPNGTIYAHGTNDAVILLGQLPKDKEPDAAVMAASMDKPNGCVGMSRAKVETLSGGTVRRVSSKSQSFNCVMILTKADGQNLMILSMAKADSHANSDAAVQAILDSYTQDAAPALSPAPTPQLETAAPLSAGKLARAAYPVGLVGMWRSDWVENQYRAFTGLTLVALDNTLIFTSGGYFFDGVPDGVSLDDAGAVETMRADPENAGRYTVAGGKITLAYASGTKETVDAKKVGKEWELEFRNRPMSPKMTFMAGGYLSGTYSTQRITNAGSGIFVVGDDDYSFAPDGRFAKGGSVSMSSAAVSSIGGRNVKRGRYIIRASALILSYDDGSRETYSMFQETAGQNIWLNGQMYTPQ